MVKYWNLLVIKAKNIGWWSAIFYFIVSFSFFANALHESYPDEFDNILGGWYILDGKLPYAGFFTHHGPIPYFIAAIIEIFSGQSFVRFRIFYAVFLLFVTFLIFYLLKKKIGKEVSFYPFFLVFSGIMATYYWFHMLLADNLAAISLLPVYAILLLKGVLNKKITLFDVGIISVFLAIALYSSLTYTYLFVAAAMATVYLYFKNNRIVRPFISFGNFYPIILLLTPHILFLIYLLLTQGLGDYLYQNFIFNAKYYIYNYPRPQDSTFINPIRYAVLIGHWFFVNFYTLLIGIKSFDFSFPINATMAVGNVSLIVYFLFQKHYKAAFFVLFFIVYASTRSNPLNSKETDYQAAVYNIVSFFNIFYLLPVLYKDIGSKINDAKKIIFGFLIIIVGIYSFFTFLHLVFKFNEKVVSKYMGDMSLIYDRPKLAPIVNNIVGKDEYAWIGPFEFEELLYMNSKIPSKYHILIYGVGRSERTSQEMLADFSKNKPKVIMFDPQFVYLGKSIDTYGGFFLDFLKDNYVTLLQYSKDGIAYRSIAPIHPKEKVDLESKMFIRKDKVDEVVKKLIEKNYIREVKD